MLLPDADGETGRRVRPRSCASSSRAWPDSRSRSAAAGASRTRWTSSAPTTRRCWPLNVAEGDSERAELAYEETGTYQLLLPYMSDPAELKRFYSETVRPLVAYDEQYETDLLGTLATFLDCDANVNATAARLITHRHTIRYRFERVRELTGPGCLLHRRAREALARASRRCGCWGSPRRTARPASPAPPAGASRAERRGGVGTSAAEASSQLDARHAPAISLPAIVAAARCSGRPGQYERPLQRGDHRDRQLTRGSGVQPGGLKRSVPAAIQLSNTSAHASRIVSLLLETSSATVAIGQASA